MATKSNAKSTSTSIPASGPEERMGPNNGGKAKKRSRGEFGRVDANRVAIRRNHSGDNEDAAKGDHHHHHGHKMMMPYPTPPPNAPPYPLQGVVPVGYPQGYHHAHYPAPSPYYPYYPRPHYDANGGYPPPYRFYANASCPPHPSSSAAAAAGEMPTGAGSNENDNNKNGKRPEPSSSSQDPSSARHNRRQKKMYSDFVGVTYNKKHAKYQACITHSWKQIYLGRYKLAVDAALAYDESARKLKGSSWKVNFPTKEAYEGAKARELEEIGRMGGRVAVDAAMYDKVAQQRLQGSNWNVDFPTQEAHERAKLEEMSRMGGSMGSVDAATVAMKVEEIASGVASRYLPAAGRLVFCDVAPTRTPSGGGMQGGGPLVSSRNSTKSIKSFKQNTKSKEIII